MTRKLLDRDEALDELASEVSGQMTFEEIGHAMFELNRIMLEAKSDEELFELAEEFEVHVCNENCNIDIQADIHEHAE